MPQNNEGMSPRYVDLTTDSGFKAVFGDERNKDVVIRLLNTFLAGEHHVVEIEYLNNEQIGESLTSKGVRYDLHCRDSSGVRFIVEMQRVRNDEDFFARSVYYGSRIYSLQLDRGSRRYNMAPVYVIGIMEGHLEHVSDRECMVCYTMSRNGVDEIAPKTISCIFAQLGYFDKRKDECEGLLDQWLYCLKHMKGLETIPEGFCPDEMSPLFTASEIARFDKNKRISYDQTMMYERDYNNDMYYSHKHGVEEGMEKGRAEGKAEGRAEGKAEGRAEGKAEGRAEEKITAARNFKKLGVAVETISEALGLTPEEIEAL